MKTFPLFYGSKRLIFLRLLSLTLFISATGCTLWDEVVPPATPAPTLAPTAAPPENTPPPLQSEPQTFDATARKLDFASDGTNCALPAQIHLTIQPDGSAELRTTGADITDHYNCTTSGEETWILNGTADALQQTIIFSGCNFGGFRAQGTLTFSQNQWRGEVSCFAKDDKIAISLIIE